MVLPFEVFRLCVRFCEQQRLWLWTKQNRLVFRATQRRGFFSCYPHSFFDRRAERQIGRYIELLMFSVIANGNGLDFVGVPIAKNTDSAFAVFAGNVSALCFLNDPTVRAKGFNCATDFHLDCLREQKINPSA
jgi:hypothetical protein